MKEWTFSICMLVVSSIMFKIILPQGELGKIVNFLISLFLLTIIFSDLIMKKDEYRFELETFQTKEKDINNQLKSLRDVNIIGELERRLGLKIKQELLLKEIPVEKVLINVDSNEKTNILINKMEVILKKGSDINEREIKEYIYQNYKIIPDFK